MTHRFISRLPLSLLPILSGLLFFATAQTEETTPTRFTLKTNLKDVHAPERLFPTPTNGGVLLTEPNGKTIRLMYRVYPDKEKKINEGHANEGCGPAIYQDISTDGGQTWTLKEKVFESDFNSNSDVGYVHPDNGEIYWTYRIGKDTQPYFIRSSKNRTVWEPDERTHLPFNLRYDTGSFMWLKDKDPDTGHRRLLFASHDWKSRGGVTWWSDDDGTTWEGPSNDCNSPRPSDRRRWGNASNNGHIVELNDGRLWMLLRNSHDHLWEYFSEDRGETWSKGQPSRFYGVFSNFRMFRIPDGRIMVTWMNCLPDMAHNKMYHNTVRDVVHAAISDDDGKTWRGFRELLLGHKRHALVFSPFYVYDVGTHHPKFTVTKDNKAIFFTGQDWKYWHHESEHRQGLIFDLDWLYDTSRKTDFSNGYEDLSVQKLSKNTWGKTTYFSRALGATVEEHPTKPFKNILRLGREPCNWVRNEQDGANWNFPIGKYGTLQAKILLKEGQKGASIALSDVFHGPSNNVGDDHAMYRVQINPSGKIIGSDTVLQPNTWHTLGFKWYGTEDKDVDFCEVSVNGRPALDIPLKNISPNGICYARLRSTAPSVDLAGWMIESLEANILVNPPPREKAPAISPTAIQIDPIDIDTAYALDLDGQISASDFGGLHFSKASGPEWLSVAANGHLTGTPNIYNAGKNVFEINVRRDHSKVTKLQLEIMVSAERDRLATTEMDAYVKAGKSSGTNFGEEGTLAVKTHSTLPDTIRQSFLQFDVKHLRIGPTDRVYLRINVSGTHNLGPGSEGHIYFVTDDTWTESEITWKNKPLLNETPHLILDTSNAEPEAWVMYDVTELATSESAGDGLLSLCLAAPDNNTLITYFSSEAAKDVRPYLAVKQTGQSRSKASGSPTEITTVAASLDEIHEPRDTFIPPSNGGVLTTDLDGKTVRYMYRKYPTPNRVNEGGTHEGGGPIVYQDISRDGGLTWEHGEVMFETEYHSNSDMGHVHPDTGELYWTYRLGKKECYMIRLSADRKSWTQKVKLPCDVKYDTASIKWLRNKDPETGNRRMIIATGDLVNGRYGGVTYTSDDNGLTWQGPSTLCKSPPVDPALGVHGGGSNCGHIIELKDGRLWMLQRNPLEHLWEYFSDDRGETWDAGRPSRFVGIFTCFRLYRLPDDRIAIVYLNTMPSRSRNKWHHHHNTNRDAVHMAISDDEGETWRGFREVMLGRRRHEFAYSELPKYDAGSHHAKFTVTKDNKVIFFTGQDLKTAMYESVHRVGKIFDLDWLYENSSRIDFSNGYDGLSVQKLGKTFYKNTNFYPRKIGAEVVKHPDDPSKKALHLRRETTDWVRNEQDGANWNFPAGTSGTFTARILLKSGQKGASIALTDTFYLPASNEGEKNAMYQLKIDETGTIEGSDAVLAPDTWHEIKLAWQGTQDLETDLCRVSVNGKPLDNVLRLNKPSRNGISYARLRATAPEEDLAGWLAESLDVIVR